VCRGLVIDKELGNMIKVCGEAICCERAEKHALGDLG
jgi:hypothetical protein